MKDEKLVSILKKINLSDCTPVIEDYIYHIEIPLRQRVSCSGGGYKMDTSIYEFLIITDEGEKKAIILRCGYEDLHWHVLKPWRGQHILSNALRTGIIQKVWPENTSLSCFCNWDDNYDEKRRMTKHLAKIAGLTFKEE